MRYHDLKYQGIVTPDGITISLSGSFPGSVYDQSMLFYSGIIEELGEYVDLRNNGGRLYTIYGNPA